MFFDNNCPVSAYIKFTKTLDSMHWLHTDLKISLHRGLKNIVFSNQYPFSLKRKPIMTDPFFRNPPGNQARIILFICDLL